jgi:hypothetical protein
MLATALMMLAVLAPVAGAGSAPADRVAKHSVSVTLKVVGYQSLRGVSVRLDGRYVTSSVTATGESLSLVAMRTAPTTSA